MEKHGTDCDKNYFNVSNERTMISGEAMGKLLAVSQERQARTRMKIMEDEYVRKNRKAEYYEQDINSGEGTANIQRRIQRERK